MFLQLQREQVEIMRGIRMDLERMQFAIQNRDGRGYVPPSRQEIGIQADEVKPEVQEPKPKKKKDTSIKEIDPEVKFTIPLFHVLLLDFMFASNSKSSHYFSVILYHSMLISHHERLQNRKL